MLVAQVALCHLFEINPPAHVIYDTIQYIYVRSKADKMASLI